MLKAFAVLLLLADVASAQALRPPVNTRIVYTVGTLPTCNAGAQGLRYIVTDALGPVVLATVVGGGAVIVPVFCNGSNWTVG